MIAIIDYGVGNLGSIANMFKKIGVQAAITSDHDSIARADKLILPGVGAFDNGMHKLSERGLVPLLNERVLEQKTPILGLCLGMQLFTQKSEEGQLPGLGWIDAETVRFKLGANYKVPHMGWNTLDVCQPHPVFANTDPEMRFYFVHSYHVVCNDHRNVLARTQYGYDFDSVIANGNIVGVQFHPEKSHAFGMQLLKNFAENFVGMERA